MQKTALERPQCAQNEPATVRHRVPHRVAHTGGCDDARGARVQTRAPDPITRKQTRQTASKGQPVKDRHSKSGRGHQGRLLTLDTCAARAQPPCTGTARRTRVMRTPHRANRRAAGTAVVVGVDAVLCASRSVAGAHRGLSMWTLHGTVCARGLRQGWGG